MRLIMFYVFLCCRLMIVSLEGVWAFETGLCFVEPETGRRPMRRHQLCPPEPCGSPCVNQGAAITGICKAPLEIRYSYVSLQLVFVTWKRTWPEGAKYSKTPSLFALSASTQSFVGNWVCSVLSLLRNMPSPGPWRWDGKICHTKRAPLPCVAS